MASTSDPLYRTVKLIAKTTAFRNWCGIDTAQTEDEQYADAKERCHIHQVDVSAARPFALLEWGENRTYDRQGMSYLLTADVSVSFVNTFSGETADNIETLNQNVTAILNDIMEIAGTGDLILFDTLQWQGWDIVEVNQNDDVAFDVWSFSGPQWGRSDY